MKAITVFVLTLLTKVLSSQDDLRCVTSDTYMIMSKCVFVKNKGVASICYDDYYFSFKTPESGLITFKIERHTRNKNVVGNKTNDSFLNEETQTHVRGFYHVDISQGPELTITINYPMVENGYAILLSSKTWANGDEATFEIISSHNKLITDSTGLSESEKIAIVDEKKNKQQIEIYTVAGQSPEFPGGIAELMRYIQKNLQYPDSAKEMGITGKCYLRIAVLSDGTIGEIKIRKGVDNCKACDKEAIELVRKMPKWTPGKNGNKFVNTWFDLPVSFKGK